MISCNESCNDDNNEWHFLEDDVKYAENLHNLQNDLPFLPEIMKIEYLEKLVANLHNKVIHKKNLEQVLNHAIVLTKVHRSIKLNQKSWLEP